jgi:endonuclease YncB( thermonuclease family)
MTRCFLSIVMILLVLTVGRDALAETLRGMVKTVYDGDTVVIVGRGTGRATVRLYGIDAPETRKPKSSGQPYGSQARRVLMYKLLGKEVTAAVQERDQYGRTVAVIELEGRDINAEMVAEGMAWAYRQYLAGPYASRYIGLEGKARRQHRGLWRENNPQPPWEFRHGQKR